jgi:hypothetical protein
MALAGKSDSQDVPVSKAGVLKDFSALPRSVD